MFLYPSTRSKRDNRFSCFLKFPLFKHQEVLCVSDIKYIENAKYTQDWAKAKGQSLFPENGCESITITCISNDQGWDINNINDKLLQRGYRMDRGYGKLRGKAFRIAHMGNIMKKDLEEFLFNFDEVLNV